MPALRPWRTLPQRAWKRARLEWILRWRIPAYTTIEGWLNGDQAAALYELAAAVPAGRSVVEIGSWKGRSTYCLARGLRGGRVIVIDPFDASGDSESAAGYAELRGGQPLIDQFRGNMARLGVSDRIDLRPGFSRDFVGRVPAGYGLLFIDGDHSLAGCRFDFENFAPGLAAGGYLCLHDFDPARPDFGPTWVVNHLVQPSGQYRFLRQAGTLWIGQKR